VASSFRDVVTAIVDDLTTNVPALREVLVHRYASWDPGQLVVEAGERHLAVWPAPDRIDTSAPLTTDGGKLLVQIYQIIYWEDAGDESSRGIADEEAAAELFDLIEAIRARFFVRSNVFLGGTDYLEYVGSTGAERSASVRWFVITLTARTSLTLT
jgi:hypothetical protein